MRKVAKFSSFDREALFRNTAAKIGLSEGIVEKDFWVCFILDYLFYDSPWRHNFAFKGGTSLSKAYNLIERFSEDVDLILDWTVLGYEADAPLKITSNNKMEQFKKDCMERFNGFLLQNFIPQTNRDIKELLGKEELFSLSNEVDGPVVLFNYPSIFRDLALVPNIRLEIGPLAAWTPTQKVLIVPYIAEQYPALFDNSGTSILTTTAERTFWEKVTILHAEAHRDPNDPEHAFTPARYSRHYYDLYKMASTPIKKSALAETQLLRSVANFKDKFYHSKRARYDLAKPGSLKLLPAPHNENVLRKDYEAMRSMIYGNYPSYEDVIRVLKSLEDEINSL